MFQKKSKIIILILVFVISTFLIIPSLKNIGLLFYSQYQNGVRCQWIDDQHSMNSVWVELENEYLLSFVQGSDFCELKKEGANTIKGEFFTSDVYFYKPGKEVLDQNDEPAITATWTYDEKTEFLFVEMIVIEENSFGLEEGKILTFKKQSKTGDGSVS